MATAEITQKLDSLVNRARLAPFSATGSTAQQRSRGLVAGHMVDVFIRGAEVRYEVTASYHSSSALTTRDAAEAVLTGEIVPEDAPYTPFGLAASA